jgi:hypothetical protein
MTVRRNHFGFGRHFHNKNVVSTELGTKMMAKTGPSVLQNATSKPILNGPSSEF